VWKTPSCEKLIFFELCSFFYELIIIDLEHWNETGVELQSTKPPKKLIGLSSFLLFYSLSLPSKFIFKVSLKKGHIIKDT